MKKVLFCPANPDGCALFRMFMPHLRYRDSLFILPPKGEGIPADLLKLGQVVMVQRQTTRINYEGAKLIKLMGLKYVYDLDDNLWHVPKYNQMKGYFKEQIMGVEKCLSMADHVTVSTTHLASIVRRKTQLNCPITVVENAVDLSLFGRSRRQKNADELIIGWAGTNTHTLDLQYVVAPIIEVMRKRKNIVFEYMGSDFPIDERYRQELGNERFRFRPWVEVEQWPAYCSSLPWDIALAPLLITSFNASKSGIKMVESGSRRCPCIASATQEYARFAEGNEMLTRYLICEKRDEWHAKLLALVDSISLRDTLGELMFERVKSRYNMEERIEQWRAVFES